MLRHGRPVRCVAGGLLLAGSAVISLSPADRASAGISADNTFSYTGPAVAIADSSGVEVGGTPATASVSVSGLSGGISDIDLRFDGSACTSAAGSTTVGLEHTFINDLQVTLISPSGKEVLVLNRNDGGGNNLCGTTLDDAAATPVGSWNSIDAPFSGTYSPANPLAGFNGLDPNGAWTLKVQDFFTGDTGNIRAFSLIIDTQTSAVVTARKTVSGTFEEAGSVTYSVVLSNSGNTAAGDNAGHEFTDVLPAGLTLTSATASSGATIATIATNTVTWDGSVAAHGSVTIGITATVNAGTQNQTISNQGSLSYDADIDGVNETSGVTDDPGVGGAADPTSFTVGDLVPHVTVTLDAGQENPTSDTTIHFHVAFTEPVTGFDETDVLLSGTAGATTAVVTGSGADYDVAVSGMTGPGTVIVSVPEGAAMDATSTPNTASTGNANVAGYQVAITHVGAPASVQYSMWLGLGLLASGAGLFLMGRRRTA